MKKKNHQSEIYGANLKVRDDFAERVAHEPSLGNVPHHGRRQTEEDDEEVGDGQIDYEHVGDGTHRVIAIDGQAYEEVTNEADEEDEYVEACDDPLVL